MVLYVADGSHWYEPWPVAGVDVEAVRQAVTSSARERLGELIARRAIAAGVSAVFFDRGGYRYHGQVKALADAAREAGLAF